VDAAREKHIVYAGLRDVETADALRAASAGLSVTPVPLDVTLAGDREQVVARVLAEQGRIDVLVNNAGRALGGPLEQVSEDELRRLFDVNVFGAWALTKACLPAMRKQRAGRVIQITSMSGRQGIPFLGAYAGSKFALEGMSEAWRRELAPLGIDVVIIEPGAYRTDMLERNKTICQAAWDEPDYAPMMRSVNALADDIIANRARDPREVSALVVKLVGAARTQLRYALGPGVTARVLAMKVLPQRALEQVVRMAVKRGERLASKQR
jgi:NAD(P)-dependent dehydrogenase (short-subunit alcohol dehydrogenase family)